MGPALRAAFNPPGGMARDSAGNFYVADGSNRCLRKIDASGNVTTIVGHAKVSGVAPTVDNTNGADVYFGFPSGVAFEGVQTLFVSDGGNGVVLAVSLADSTYKTSVLVGDPTAQGYMNGIGKAARFESPRGLAYDAAKKLLDVADANSETVRRVDLTNIAMPNVTRLSGTAYGRFDETTPAGDNGPLSSTRHNTPAGLALTADGSLLFVSNQDGETVQRLDLTNNLSATVVGAPLQGFVSPGELPGRVQGPYGLAIIGSRLFVTSRDENVVLAASGLVP